MKPIYLTISGLLVFAIARKTHEHLVSQQQSTPSSPSSSPLVNQQSHAPRNASQLAYDDPHSYIFDEVNPGRYEQFLPLKRKPSVTNEYFPARWKFVHGDLTIAAQDIKIQILRYIHFHRDAYHRHVYLPYLLQRNIKPAPYDGFAELHVHNFSHFQKFWVSVFANSALTEDTHSWLDEDFGMHIMAGYDNYTNMELRDECDRNGRVEAM